MDQRPAAREWDLVVSYFGSDPNRYREAGTVRIDDRGAKWPGLHALLCRENLWRDYDYIWLPDDDLAVDQASVNALFEITASSGLALTQPALSWSSFYSHPVTIRHPSFSLRLTDFIEIMAPCFERSALETCLPMMADTLSGWGLDWVWPRLVAGAAIIDDVTVTHTRPVGGPNRSLLLAAGVLPAVEAETLRRKFGIAVDGKPQVLAAVDRNGRRLERAHPPDAEVLDARLRGDWADFLDSRQRLDLPPVSLPIPTSHWRVRW